MSALEIIEALLEIPEVYNNAAEMDRGAQISDKLWMFDTVNILLEVPAVGAVLIQAFL